LLKAVRAVPIINMHSAVSNRCKELFPVIGRLSEEVCAIFRDGAGAFWRLSVVVVTDTGAWVVVVTELGMVVVFAAVATVVVVLVVVVVTAAADQRAYRVTSVFPVGV
jgi:hypothetical protein